MSFQPPGLWLIFKEASIFPGREIMMEKFAACLQTFKRDTDRAVSLLAVAFLIGGLMAPGLSAYAVEIDVTISVGKTPVDITINSTGTFAYVANNGSNTVSKINLATNKVVATIKVDIGPAQVAINLADTFVYVINSPPLPKIGTLSRINLATNKVDVKIPLDLGLSGLVINSAGTFAYITSEGFESGPGRVFRINLATNTVDATIVVGYIPREIAIDPAGTFAYVVNSNTHLEDIDIEGIGSVSKINLATNKVVSTIEVGIDPRDVTINPAGTFAYVTNAISGQISKINLANDTVDAEITSGCFGSVPFGMAIDPAAKFAYIACFGYGTVVKINLATNIVTETIQVNGGPYDVAINPAGTFAYVVNYSPNTVSRIKLATSVTPDSSPLILSASESSSARAIATYANIAVPKGATISISISASSVKYCKITGTSLNGVKAGTCKVTVTIKPIKGKTESRTVTLTVTK